MQAVLRTGRGRDRGLGVPLCLLAASWLAVLLISCGLKGPPQPRETVVPMPVADLVLRAEAGGVRLSFTLPEKSLDGSALRAIGGYRIVRRSPAGKESGQEVRFSVSEQKQKVGRPVVFHDALSGEAGTHWYWVLPMDAYGSHPRREQGVPFTWAGAPPEAGSGP